MRVVPFGYFEDVVPCGGGPPDLGGDLHAVELSAGLEVFLGGPALDVPNAYYGMSGFFPQDVECPGHDYCFPRFRHGLFLGALSVFSSGYSVFRTGLASWTVNAVRESSVTCPSIVP